MLVIVCYVLDVGNMLLILWVFEEREKLMEFYERVLGVCMYVVFYRFNEINLYVIFIFLLEDILEFCRNFFIILNEMYNVLIYNKIWK